MREHAPSGPQVIGPPAEHPVRGVVLLATLLTSIAVLLIFLTDWTTAVRPAPTWMLPVVAGCFVLSERFSFFLEYRREAISFTLSEVPTALALVFLDPITAVVVRCVTSVVTMTAVRRKQPYKIFFNFALYAFEMAVAVVIVHRMVDQFGSNDWLVLGVVWLAITVSTLTGMMMVSTAIAMFEGGLFARLRGEVRTSAFVLPLSALIGVTCLAPALARPALALVTLIPIVAVWLLLQRYGHLAQRHRDLQALHGFSKAIGGSLDLDEIVDAALGRAVTLLRAESGSIQVYDRNGALVVSESIGSPRRPTDRNDPEWAEVFERSSAAWLRFDGERPELVERSIGGSALAIPVVDGGEVLGLLVVSDRAGAADAFEESDESSIEMLASQLSSSVRKAILHATMEHAALHDALTGDANRPAFEQRIDEALRAGRGPGSAVMMLDLDKFKEVNDTLGHHVGDRVLVQFASRIRSIIGPDELLARFGGDEFAVFVPNRDMPGLRALADQILTSSYAPLHLDDLDFVVTTSVGIAVVTDDDRDAAAVLRRADIAMYTAKNEHSGFEVYREEIDRRTPERLSLLGDLRDAIDCGDIQVHYQPKVDLATETVIGAEALARWHHPVRGWVPPADFVAVAEETGLIKAITDQVLTTALRTAKGWQAAGTPLRVAVNLSTHDLLDELLAERIARRLEQQSVSPGMVTLEITESSLLADTPRTMTTIERLRRLGVQLSLDDFGTGYSSLSYLRRLPVSELKVDRSFVSNMLLDQQDDVIVKSTIDLGHNLGLKVVAEGIESTPVMERLAQLGCDIGQGYGISRPLDAEQFAVWLGTTRYAVHGLSEEGVRSPVDRALEAWTRGA